MRAAVLALVLGLSVSFTLKNTVEVVPGTAVPIEITCQEDNPCWFVRMEYR